MSTAIEEVIALEIARGRRSNLADRQTAQRIMQIPEVGEGVEMRAQRRAVLNLDSDEGKREAVRRINDLIEALQLDDGYHERLIDDLRGIAAELTL